MDTKKWDLKRTIGVSIAVLMYYIPWLILASQQIRTDTFLESFVSYSGVAFILTVVLVFCAKMMDKNS